MKKTTRTKGKIQMSRYFQNLENGEKVAIVMDISMPASFPKRLQGRTGIVEEKRGKYYVVKIMEDKKEKKFLISPIHLKKIKNV